MKLPGSFTHRNRFTWVSPVWSPSPGATLQCLPGRARLSPLGCGFFFRRNEEVFGWFLWAFFAILQPKTTTKNCPPQQKGSCLVSGNGYFNKNESRLVKYRNLARGFWSHYRNCCYQRWGDQLSCPQFHIFEISITVKTKESTAGPILAINSSAGLRICYLPMFHEFLRVRG